MRKKIDEWIPFLFVLTFVIVGTAGMWIRRFFKKPWVTEALTVAMFIGGIGLVLALAIPGSHLIVAVLY